MVGSDEQQSSTSNRRLCKNQPWSYLSFDITSALARQLPNLLHLQREKQADTWRQNVHLGLSKGRLYALPLLVAVAFLG